MLRRIDHGGFAYEEEHVQLTLIGGTAERESNSITMVQHDRVPFADEPVAGAFVAAANCG